MRFRTFPSLFFLRRRWDERLEADIAKWGRKLFDHVVGAVTNDSERELVGKARHEKGSAQQEVRRLAALSSWGDWLLLREGKI